MGAILEAAYHRKLTREPVIPLTGLWGILERALPGSALHCPLCSQVGEGVMLVQVLRNLPYACSGLSEPVST